MTVKHKTVIDSQGTHKTFIHGIHKTVIYIEPVRGRRRAQARGGRGGALITCPIESS